MRKPLKILILAESMLFLAGGLFGPIYAIFVERIGGDLLTAGSAYGLFSIVAGVCTFFISRMEDHSKHQEKFVIISYFLSFLGYLGYSFISRTIHLFMVQVIFGIAGAVGAPAYNGLFSKNLDKGKFISEWGLYDTSAYILTGIAAVTGGFLARAYGFALLFKLMGFLSFIGFISSIFLLMKKKRKQRKQERSKKKEIV